MKKAYHKIEIGDQELYIEIIQYPGEKGMKDSLGQEIEPTQPSYIEIINIEPMDNNKFDLYNLLFEFDSSSKSIFKLIEDKVWEKIHLYGEK